MFPAQKGVEVMVCGLDHSGSQPRLVHTKCNEKHGEDVLRENELPQVEFLPTPPLHVHVYTESQFEYLNITYLIFIIRWVNGTGSHLSQHSAGMNGTGSHLSQHSAGVNGTGSDNCSISLL